jgi:DNA-binding MarR family transcriptional regulator
VVAISDRGQDLSGLLSQIARVHGLLLSAEERLARPAGITGARWQVLEVVGHGPVTLAQAARTLGLTRQAVRETAGALVSLGMLERRANPYDRRAPLLALTPRGRATVRAVARRRTEWTNRLAARAAQTDLPAITGVLRDLGDLLEGSYSSSSSSRGAR